MRLIEIKENYDDHIVPDNYYDDYMQRMIENRESIYSYKHNRHLTSRKVLIDMDSIYRIEPFRFKCKDENDTPYATTYVIYYGQNLKTYIDTEEYNRLMKILNNNNNLEFL